MESSVAVEPLDLETADADQNNLMEKELTVPKIDNAVHRNVKIENMLPPEEIFPSNSDLTAAEINAHGSNATEDSNTGSGDLSASKISEKEEEMLELPREYVEELDVQPATKVSGYLSKKGKLRMVSSWKKYWFVLDSRLLLYYRSKAEYEALGSCKGSITLGSPCNIKPGSASNCVFQIENRNNTVSLRAENRAEQDKWMLAILGALKQTSPSTRMSHFRYSADDLVVRPPADMPPIPALTRQNTLPDRMSNNFAAPQVSSKEEKPAKTLLERIESIGGQSYISNSSKASPKLPKNTNLKKLLDKQISVASSKSDRNSWIEEEDDVRAETIENDFYDTFDATSVRDPSHIYQEIPTDVHVEPTVIVENCVDIDQNKNKVEYWEPIYDSAKTIEESSQRPSLPPRPPQQDGLGADEIDKADKKSLCKLAKIVKEDRRAGAKRQSFVIRMFKKIKRQDSLSKGDPKCRNREKLGSTETGEKERLSAEERRSPEQSASDIKEHAKGCDLHSDVITELSQAIETKVDQGKHSEDKDRLSEEGSVKSENGQEATETEPISPQLEQFSQLAQPQIPLKQEQIKEISEPKTEECAQAQASNLPDFDYDIYDPSQRLNIPRPKLICKAKRPKRFKVTPVVALPTPEHDQQQLAEATELTDHVVPHLKDENKLLTIDEILDDLENQNYEPFSRQKVKELIEKFNDTETDADGEDAKDELHEIQVQLRRKHLEQSEELNSLLDELSKVAHTNVTSPQTCQLNDDNNNEPYSVEEWKNIVPIRKRRHSDPDYDIPRPHSALQIIPNLEKDESKMQPTRFFGPVIIEPMQGDSTSCGTSITPDSLEVEALTYQAKTYTPSIEEDRSMRSYTSHIYASSDSHLNNNLTHNSHINHKLHTVIASNEGAADKQKEAMLQLTTTSPSPSTAPQNVEWEQAFYLNHDNDHKENGDGILQTAKKCVESQLIALSTECTVEDISNNSVCYDSLEPFSEDLKH